MTLSNAKRKSRTGLIVMAAAAAIVAVAAILVIRAERPLETVQPILWDRETCASCGMAISDHRFAAQLQTADGQVRDFDDPGCLFSYVAEKHPAVRVIYFHALTGDAWLTYPEVAFVTGQDTPMGYGIGAVPVGAAGAVTIDRAKEIVAAKDREIERGGGPDAREARP